MSRKTGFVDGFHSRKRWAAGAGQLSAMLVLAGLIASCGSDKKIAGPDSDSEPMHTAIHAVLHPGGDHVTASVSVDGHCVPEAQLTVNGDAIELFSEDVMGLGLETAFFEFVEGFAAGQAMTAQMTGGGRTRSFTAVMPAPCTITAPLLGETVSRQSGLRITWTTPTNPQRILVTYGTAEEVQHFVVVNGAQREVTIPAQILQQNGTGERQVVVTAVNGGGELNPNDYQEEDGFYAEAPPDDIVTSITVE